MHRIAAISLVALCLLGAAASPSAAQPPSPAALAADGRHAEAEALYDRALAADPRSVTHRVGRGYVRAWQKRYDAAIEDFRAALAIDPRNRDAGNGLGWTLAWAGRHPEAEARFRASLAQDASDLDAAKGLGYVALWRGDAPTAVAHFTALVAAHPGNAEMHVALGHARVAAGDAEGAREAFAAALRAEPGRADAQRALGEVPTARAGRYEATAFTGRTRFGDGRESSGLRFVQLAMQATPSLRLWLIYDSGLARDNADLAARNVDADAYYVGGLRTYGSAGTRLEAGRRELDNGGDQTLLRGEQLFFLDGGWVPKLGFWSGRASGASTEYTLHAGLSIPLGRRLRLEPTVYRSRNAADERETRALLFGEYLFAGGATLGVGYADGHKSNVVAPATADSRRETLLAASLPLGDAMTVALQGRRETGAGQPDTDLVALGLTVHF